MEEMVWLNGSLIPRSQARLSPFDYGFLYGYGLFETMRAYSGRIFRLERHLERLSRSARILGINLPIETPELEKVLYAVLRANKLTNARLRLTLSAGEGEVTPDVSSCRTPALLIVTSEYTPHSSQTYQQGFKAIVSSIRRNSQTSVSGLKSLNYLGSLLARREAKTVGADEAIVLNEEGFLAEGSMSNIFLVSGNTLLTPSEDSGTLPGITRGVVLELALSLGIEAIERKITLEELLQADEAFLTSSLMEIMPLTSIAEQSIGSGRAGIVTKKFVTAYKKLVEQIG